MMLAAILIRVASQILSSIMGGCALFCLYDSAQIPDYDVARYLVLSALKWGGCATAIVYFQDKYLV
jgi:hypothetical protein